MSRRRRRPGPRSSSPVASPSSRTPTSNSCSTTRTSPLLPQTPSSTRTSRPASTAYEPPSRSWLCWRSSPRASRTASRLDNLAPSRPRRQIQAPPAEPGGCPLQQGVITSRVVVRDQADLLEHRQLVPVLPERTDPVTPELGDGGAVDGDPCPCRLDDLAPGEHQRARMRQI